MVALATTEHRLRRSCSGPTPGVHVGPLAAIAWFADHPRTSPGSTITPDPPIRRAVKNAKTAGNGSSACAHGL
jgi:hypothetical protein